VSVGGARKWVRITCSIGLRCC